MALLEGLDVLLLDGLRPVRTRHISVLIRQPNRPTGLAPSKPG